MAITEASRHHLHQRLEAVLGPEEALTMMEHLPPVGWADVATKHDLDQLHLVISKDIANLGLELRVEMGQKLNRLLLQLLASMAAFVTMVLLITRAI